MPLNPDMSVFLDKAKAAGAVEISTLTPQQGLPQQLLLYMLATFPHFIIKERRRGDLNS
jgi:hypothetical protein